MTTAVLDDATTVVRTRTAGAPIPLVRLVAVELRKMFDTRSGFWLMASIVITSVLATAALIVFADDAELTFDNFAAAIGIPMTVILPMIGILAVTSEWTQRSGLTTFTLVPHRGRVLGAKLLAAVTVGVVAMVVALAVGTLGTLVGSAVTGLDPVWNSSPGEFLHIVLGSVLGMLLGFTLGVLVRNSSGAIVTYFVYTLVLPPLLGLLAANQAWFRDLQPWVDLQFAQMPLFNGALSTEQWQQLASAGTLWLLVPLGVGLLLVRRAEVK
ncbi:ABC transporter permease [Oryzobacter sp. R7]|uniref:ABC transporter permease n=1 Tax=Oryzobacter faecalis TaxID=3388656 RepID=UPI00398D05B6